MGGNFTDCSYIASITFPSDHNDMILALPSCLCRGPSYVEVYNGTEIFVNDTHAV